MILRAEDLSEKIMLVTSDSRVIGQRVVQEFLFYRPIIFVTSEVHRSRDSLYEVDDQVGDMAKTAALDCKGQDQAKINVELRVGSSRN